MEMLDHTIFLVSSSILILPPYDEREKKPSKYCDFAFADGGNRIWATSTASERTIPSIAPRKGYIIAKRHAFQNLMSFEH